MNETKLSAKKEFSDYSMPMDPAIDLRSFTKDFLVKIAEYWCEYFAAYHKEMLAIGSQTEGIGEKMKAIQDLVMEKAAPKEFTAVAEYCKMDISLVNDWIKEGNFLPHIDLTQYTKESVLQILRHFSLFWEAYQSLYVKVSTQVFGLEAIKITDVQITVLYKVIPAPFRKVAALCKVDVNTMEGIIKAGRFAPDNLPDHYTGGVIDIISDSEATMTFEKCSLLESGHLPNDVKVLNHICSYVEPRITEAMMGIGDHKIKCEMLWYPKELPAPTDKPICKWRFSFAD